MLSRRALSRSLAAVVCALVLTGCESKVTTENYDKITVGMSLSEVEGLLGSGELQDSAGTSIGSSGLTGAERGNPDAKTYAWGEESKQIVVNFVKGVVVSKTKRGL